MTARKEEKLRRPPKLGKAIYRLLKGKKVENSLDRAFGKQKKAGYDPWVR